VQQKKLLTKFNYTHIYRENINGQRYYATPDGEKLPSVTSILSATASEEKKEILENWRKKVGYKTAEEITSTAAARGTRMHKFLEDYCTTGSLGPSGSNPYSIQSHKMADTIISNSFIDINEIWGIEIPLYYPGLYAGTTDCAGIHLNKECIIDYKQTNKPKKREWIDDYFLQLVFYGTAHNKLYNTNIQKGVILMCSQHYEFQEFIIEGEEWKFYENKMWDKVELYYKNLINT